MTIRTEVQKFLEYHATRSLRTARAYQTALGHFQAHLEEIAVDLDGDPAQIEKGHLVSFLSYLASVTYQRGTRGELRPLSMKTRQLYTRAVTGFIRMAALEGAVHLSYADYSTLSEELARRTRANSEPIDKRLPTTEMVQDTLGQAELDPPWKDTPLSEERRRRLSLIWLRNRAMAHCLFSSGMRVAELVSLRLDDLNFPDQGAWVRGKGDKTRFVRFSNTAWRYVEAYLMFRDGTQFHQMYSSKAPLFIRHDTGAGKKIIALSTLTVQRVVNQFARDAGVKFHFTPHTFRHFFATKMLRETGNLALVQDALGHADPGTTRIYAKTSREEMIEAHKEVFNG